MDKRCHISDDKAWNSKQKQTQESKVTNAFHKSSWIIYERRNGTKYTAGNYPVYEKFNKSN